MQADRIDPAMGRRFLNAMDGAPATRTHTDFDGGAVGVVDDHG
jgi:hypothetical protein